MAYCCRTSSAKNIGKTRRKFSESSAVLTIILHFRSCRPAIYALQQTVQDEKARLHRQQTAGQNDGQERPHTHHHHRPASEGNTGLFRNGKSMDLSRLCWLVVRLTV